MRSTKVTEVELNKYAKSHGWEHQMRNSKGLDSFDNYGGENLGELVVVTSRSRDSEILEESNFDAALELLGGTTAEVIAGDQLQELFTRVTGMYTRL